MVVVARDLLAGHARQQRQLGELRGREHLFVPHSAVTVEDVQHVIDYVHLLHLLALHVQHLLPGIVVIAHLHVPLLLYASTNQVQRVLHHDLLHVFVDCAHLLLGLRAHVGLVLDVEGRVVVGLQQPGVEILVDEHVDADDVEALAVHFGEGRAIVVLEEGINASEETLGQLLYPAPQQSHIHAVLHQFLPNHLQASLPALAEGVLAVDEIGVVFVEAVVGEMDVRIVEVFLAGLLVVFSAEACQSFLIEVADVGIER